MSDSVEKRTWEPNFKQQLFIDWKANLQHDEEGNKQTMDQFAELIDVNVQTLYKWQKDIPDFHSRVADAVTNVYIKMIPTLAKTNYKYALKGSYNHMKIIHQQARKLAAEKTEAEINHTGEVQFTNGIPRRATEDNDS